MITVRSQEAPLTQGTRCFVCETGRAKALRQSSELPAQRSSPYKPNRTKKAKSFDLAFFVVGEDGFEPSKPKQQIYSLSPLTTRELSQIQRWLLYHRMNGLSRQKSNFPAFPWNFYKIGKSEQLFSPAACGGAAVFRQSAGAIRRRQNDQRTAPASHHRRKASVQSAFYGINRSKI